MEALIVSLQSVWNDSGFEGLTSGLRFRGSDQR